MCVFIHPFINLLTLPMTLLSLPPTVNWQARQARSLHTTAWRRRTLAQNRKDSITGTMGLCEDQRTWNVHATVIREKEEGGATRKKKRTLERRKNQEKFWKTKPVKLLKTKDCLKLGTLVALPFWTRISCSPGWSQIRYIAKTGF